MRDVDHAIDIIRERTGLTDLTFDACGVAEIVVDDILSIQFVRISGDTLELSTPLDDVATRVERAARALASNSD